MLIHQFIIRKFCNLILFKNSDFTQAAGHRAATRLLALDQRPDAVFAANDMMALGAVQALRERGVDVPGAVAVTGFDDVPLARYLALTTVRVHLVDLGARAVARLAERLGGGAHD